VRTSEASQSSISARKSCGSNTRRDASACFTQTSPGKVPLEPHRCRASAQILVVRSASLVPAKRLPPHIDKPSLSLRPLDGMSTQANHAGRFFRAGMWVRELPSKWASVQRTFREIDGPAAGTRVTKGKKLIFAAGASIALIAPFSKGAIKGGPHDFSASATGYSTYTYGGSLSTYANACQVCHIPHKAPDAGGSTGATAPLWNHHPSLNSSYVTYDRGNSVTFNALGLTATLGSSAACLSCHDGSMAVNQSYTETAPSQNGSAVGATAYYAPTFAIETATTTAGNWADPAGSGPYLARNDLTHMHPIGVSYSAALARDPTLKPLTSSSSILSQMLKGPSKTLECATCHDIHGVIGASSTASQNLIVDLNNGALCATCHQQ